MVRVKNPYAKSRSKGSAEFVPQQIDALLRFIAETDPEVAEKLKERRAAVFARMR
jgi:hypothetical protein